MQLPAPGKENSLSKWWKFNNKSDLKPNCDFLCLASELPMYLYETNISKRILDVETNYRKAIEEMEVRHKSEIDTLK